LSLCYLFNCAGSSLSSCVCTATGFFMFGKMVDRRNCWGSIKMICSMVVIELRGSIL
jgi:hypothetical protein